MAEEDGGPAKRAKPEASSMVDIEAIINQALSRSEDKWDKRVSDSEERWQARVTTLLEMTEARTYKNITEAIEVSEKKNENCVLKMVEEHRKEFSSAASLTVPGSPSVAQASNAGTSFTTTVDRRRSLSCRRRQKSRG